MCVWTDNVTELTQVTPDATNPTNSVITCRLRTNQKIKSISFIGISWSKRSTWYDKSWSVVVFANSSLDDGLASTGPAFSENIMKISGNINQSNPEKSQLMVEFPSETCQDSANETFACVIRYSDSDWSSTHLARAELAALQPCSKFTLSVACVICYHSKCYDALNKEYLYCDVLHSNFSYSSR